MPRVSYGRNQYWPESLRAYAEGGCNPRMTVDHMMIIINPHGVSQRKPKMYVEFGSREKVLEEFTRVAMLDKAEGYDTHNNMYRAVVFGIDTAIWEGVKPGASKPKSKPSVTFFDEAESTESEPEPDQPPEPAPVEEEEEEEPLDGSKFGEDYVPAQFAIAKALAEQRVNILLKGPTGCGKTWLASKIAEALEMEFCSVSCSIGMSESELTGWLLPTGFDGQFEYQQSGFIDRYENGGVFLFDEIDAADPNTMNFINQALANDSFYVQRRYHKPLVVKHKDFVCIAAANTFGTGADMVYVGRNQLDAATLDRFAAGIVQLNYSAYVESHLVDPEILKWGRSIRKGIQRNRLQRVLSTRLMLDLTKMLYKAGWGRKEWDRQYFANWSPEERAGVGM